MQPLSHSQDDLYVYLGKELSDIDQILSRIKNLDDNKNSPLDELHTYIEDGFFLARYNSVLEVLEYADTILQSNSNKLNPDQSEQLHNDFAFLAKKFLNGELNINPQLLEQSEHLLVSDNNMALRAAHLRTLVVDENMKVLGKTTLYKHLNCKQGAHIQGKLKVDKSAKFKKNVTIDGTLTVTDLAVLSCVDNLCVLNLSIVDEVIANLTVGNLSATNEVVANLTVTNCINSLCVNNMSVTNESVSGTLSVNNEIVNGNLSVASEVVGCDITVGCNMSMNDSTNAAVGNIIKNGIPFIHNFGTNNTFVGDNAGNFITSGSGGNSAFGVSALTNNTIGAQNTAVGVSALAANTMGVANTAIGSGSMIFNTTGIANTAVGNATLARNTTGIQNTAVGNTTLFNNTTGIQNTAVGSGALAANTTGISNTAIGFASTQHNTTGINNTAVGNNSLASNMTGINNTAIGNNALTNNTVDQNTAVGSGALAANTTGTSNTAVGFNAMENNTTGIDNTAVGYQSMKNNTIGTNNTAIGNNSLTNNTIGIQNTAVGNTALTNNTTGSQNTAVGVGALAINSTGTFNTATGFFALFFNTTGIANTAVGYQSMKNNTIGINNTAIGNDALVNNTTGTDNTALGMNTLLSTTTGSTNIAIGSGAGGTLTTGSGNVYINANAGAAAEGSTTRIGTSQTRAFMAGVRGITTGNADAIAVLIDSAGQLGTVSSTRRVKHDIKDMDSESAHIYQLHPVTFVYNNDVSETKQYGLIAEEVDEVFPEIVVKNQDGQAETVQYHVLPVLLLNEIQKQQVAIEQQRITTDNMSNAIVHLQEQINQFIERIHILEARG
jgi:hypothetical protein